MNISILIYLIQNGLRERSTLDWNLINFENNIRAWLSATSRRLMHIDMLCMKNVSSFQFSHPHMFWIIDFFNRIWIFMCFNNHLLNNLCCQILNYHFSMSGFVLISNIHLGPLWFKGIQWEFQDMNPLAVFKGL